MSSRPGTCRRFRRKTLTTVFSISLALTSGRDMATVISGISISGISDTGSLREATIPSMMSARKVIVTATGRVIRNLTIFSVYDMIYLFTEEQGAGSRERRAGG